MKSLSLQRPLVMLVIGEPGSGKSFFARQFVEMFGAPLVSFDQLQFRLFSEPTYSQEESTIVTDVMKIQIEELVKTQKLFIVDGGMNSRVSRHNIQQLTKDKGYDTLVVWVQTDQATAKKRALQRDRRRSGDNLNHSLSEDQFESIAKRLTPPQSREDVIVISGKHTFSSQARTVLKRLAANREDQPINQIKRHPKPPVARPDVDKSSSTSQRRNIILS